jgi:hypothetical protein
MAELTGTGGGAQGGAAGTTVNVTAPQGDAASTPTRASTATDRRDASRTLVERLVAQWGSEARALDVLAQENYEHREALRTVKDENAQLKANQIPTGGVVLTGPEKDAWDKIKASGVAVDKVADTVKEAITLKADKLKTDRAAAIKAVAVTAKLDPDVLAPLCEQFHLDVEERAEKVAGANGKIEDGKVAYVRSSDDSKAAWEKLDTFIAKEGSPLKLFAVALKAKGTTQQQTSTNGTQSTNSQGVTSHVVPDLSGDTSSAGSSSDDPIARRLAARQKADANRVNPLMPTQQKSATT